MGADACESGFPESGRATLSPIQETIAGYDFVSTNPRPSA